MTERPPRQLILSLFGLYARHTRQWLSVRGVVSLMEHLGVQGPAVRSSISRLKRRGVLQSERRHDVPGYAITPTIVDVLRAGDERIWGQERATADDGWLTVIFTVPESQRPQRHLLRTTLRHLGFGATSGGVWIAPATIYQETLASLERHNLTQFTDLIRGTYLGDRDTLRQRVAQWWDLDAIGDLYDDFLGDYEGLTNGQFRGGEGLAAGQSRGSEGQSVSNREAFATYVPMLTAWRRLPYRDPGIPLEFLPDDWVGETAGELFATLDGTLRLAAERHALHILADR